MSDAEFSMWQGDLLPVISTTLVGTNRLPADLTDVLVYFSLRKNDALIFEAPAVVVGDPRLGKARYEWASGDTDRYGLFDAQWRGVFQGRPMSFPGSRYNSVRINPRT